MEEAIYFYDIKKKSMKDIVGDGGIVKLEMLRGLKDYIYFIRKDESGSGSDSIQLLKTSVDRHGLKTKIEIATAPYSGEILAFELDPLNTNDIESFYQENENMEEWQDKDDQIFLIDQNFVMFKLKVDRECEVLNRVNLSQMPVLNTVLENEVRGKEFIRLSMSDRCLSLYGRVFSFQTGYQWNFTYKNNYITEDN